MMTTSTTIRKPARPRASKAPAVVRVPKWKLKQAGDGRWYYLLVGANGEPMATSTEMWERKGDANRGRSDAKEAGRIAE